MLYEVITNSLRYLRVGGRRKNFESRILFGCRKSPKTPQNPTRQVHALLGVLELRLIRITSYNVCYTKLLRNPGGASMLMFSTSKDKYEVGEKATVTMPTSGEGRAGNVGDFLGGHAAVPFCRLRAQL